MERIESFDKYISGEMSDKEVAEFKRKLSEDKDFSSDFQIYKMVVKGIVMEENDKEAELDNAFKNLSKDDLRKIVGPKKTIAKTSMSKAKIVYMASWITSVAAVAIIAFSLTFNIQRSARNNVDDISSLYSNWMADYRKSISLLLKVLDNAKKNMGKTMKLL